MLKLDGNVKNVLAGPKFAATLAKMLLVYIFLEIQNTIRGIKIKDVQLNGEN